MKRYIQIMLIALIAQCGLSNIVYAINIAPTTLGDDAIVNSIKQYSDLTEADVDQYKLLWLGSLGTYGSFIAGAVSVIGAGVGTYKTSGIVQSITPESVPAWMTNSVVLAGLGSLGAGYGSYKALYPRMRAGVLDKVQRFIDVCEAIENNTPQYLNDSQKFTILNYTFTNNFQRLKDFYLPTAWASAGDVVVHKALFNLEQQAEVADRLLGQIGLNDVEIEHKHNKIGVYKRHLSGNKQLYKTNSQEIYMRDLEIQWKKIQEQEGEREKRQEKREGAEVSNIEAEAHLKRQAANLAQVKATEAYVQMTTNAIKNTWDALNYLYKNKEKIVYRGTILSGAVYAAYLAVKAKLGYGQQ